MANPALDSVPITQRGVVPRDGNDSPVQGFGLTTSNTITLSANNTTANVPVFNVTGSVQVLGIYGVVTTDLGSNHTAAYWRINDQTAQANITLNTGTALSGIKTGSVIVKKGLAAAALAKLDNAAGLVSEPTTLETAYFSPFVAVQKTGAITNIEYNYTTTNTPTTGAIQFFVQWYPLSADGAVTPV